MIYGYCRVSTKKQKIERQIANILKAYPEAKMYSESYTGRSLDRPQWIRLYNNLHTGDMIVFDEVSRMSRNADEGFALYEELFQKGIELHFLKEPHIDTTTYHKALQNSVQMTGTAVDCILQGINQYLLSLAKEQIRLAFDTAEHEVSFLRQRTVEGIRKAHEEGKVSGHPAGCTYETKKAIQCKEIIKKHSVFYGGSLADSDIIKLCRCSRNSYYKYKKQLSST